MPKTEIWAKTYLDQETRKIRQLRVGCGLKNGIQNRELGDLQSIISRFGEDKYTHINNQFAANGKLYLNLRNVYGRTQLLCLKITKKSQVEKIGSIDTRDRDSYQFLKDSQDLKVFIKRNIFNLAGRIEERQIWVANSELELTHKLKVGQLCDNLVDPSFDILTVPCILRGNKMVLIVKNTMFHRHKQPNLIFTFDLERSSLTRLRRGDTESQSPLEQRQSDAFRLLFWSRDFLMLDDLIYFSVGN